MVIGEGKYFFDTKLQSLVEKEKEKQKRIISYSVGRGSLKKCSFCSSEFKSIMVS